MSLHLFNVCEVPFAIESTGFLITLDDADPEAMLGEDILEMTHEHPHQSFRAETCRHDELVKFVGLLAATTVFCYRLNNCITFGTNGWGLFEGRRKCGRTENTIGAQFLNHVSVYSRACFGWEALPSYKFLDKGVVVFGWFVGVCDNVEGRTEQGNYVS